jgi:hypothetical protein
MTTALTNLTAVLLATMAVLFSAGSGSVKVIASNTLAFERKSQTIELSLNHLDSLAEKDLSKIHVRNQAGNEILCQAVDADGDYTADRVIFQADFSPGETKIFTVSAGAKRTYAKHQFKSMEGLCE